MIVTLWLIIVLALIAIALGGYLSTETRLMRYHLAHAQAKAWAKAGVYLALQRLAQDAKQAEDTEPYDWLGDDWAFVPHASPSMDASVWIVQLSPPGQPPQAARNVITIQMTDEERKLNLNAATKTQLMGLGLPDEAAQAIVDYWDVEDPSDPSEDQPDVQPPYYAKDAPIVVLEELLDVPAIQERPELGSTLLGQGTVAATNGTININTASAEVLKALVDPNQPDVLSLIDRLVNSRAGLDGQLGTSDDCLATDKTTAATELASCANNGEEAPVVSLLSSLPAYDVKSSVFRMVVWAETHKPSVRYRIEAIVKREAQEEPLVEVSGEPFQILAWKEG